MAKRTKKRSKRASGSGAAGRFRLHVLDMGKTMYGDALVCEIDHRRILIDGGHPGDAHPRDGHPSIPDQLAEIFGAAAPFHFDLLIVTHCHADHIGCLPALVTDDIVTADMALVADPDIGWGRTGQDAARLPLDDTEALVLAAVREEDVSGMPPAQRDQFLTDAAKLEPAYRGMLEHLEQAQCKVTRYVGMEDGKAIEKKFADVGLKVHGPTSAHLQLCAAAIARMGRDALDTVNAATRLDATHDAVALALSIDRVGIGAALNDQSIVVSLAANGRKVLLLGDMQLADAEVTGLDGEMARLLTALSKAGPFDVIKTPHHTSYNGIDPEVLAAFAATSIWVHSGGSEDAGHPQKTALEAIKALNSGGRSISFARTDRNGLISIDLKADQVAIKSARGEYEDYTPNKARRRPDPAGLLPTVAPPPAVSGPFFGATEAGESRIEIRTFVPLGTKVRVTFEVESDGRIVGRGGPDAHTPFRLAGGRTLEPRLLFVTDPARLRAAVGPWADRCLASLRQAGHQVLSLDGEHDAASAIALVRNANTEEYGGVVLLGGPGVVPPRAVDALPEDLREQVRGTTDDPDDFFVWSDEPYGDRDGDLIAEVPVSRVPDAASASFMHTVLSATAPAGATVRGGYRNVHRPFADLVYSTVRGDTPMVVSELATHESIASGGVRGGTLYIMLHGSETDGSRYWGETADAQGLLALTPDNVGPVPGALVFTGCCWGALAWSPTARRALDGVPVTQRTVTSSLALRFLEQGARAFIGCTGAHYSPERPPYDSAGGPMHRAFWRHIAIGKPPAKALFDAKRDYAAWMESRRMTPESLAVSFKILRQYTCLGLGW